MSKFTKKKRDARTTQSTTTQSTYSMNGWSAGQRLYASSLLFLFLFLTFLGMTLNSDQPTGWEFALLLCVIGTLIPTVIYPERVLDFKTSNVRYNIRIFRFAFTFAARPIAGTKPVVLKYFVRKPRTRQAGWYLGIMLQSGKVAWFDYNKHRPILKKKMQIIVRGLAPHSHH